MNENYEKELSLTEIQKEGFNVLKEFDSLCKKHNWKYFLTYGTLLGAVRHKGFIPWDDDVDVLMFRKDFEEFSLWCNTYSNEIKPFRLCSRETVQNYPYGISRFSNMKYKYVTTEKVIIPFDIGVFIDIYPFDNYGNSKKQGIKLWKKITRLNNLVAVFMTGKCEGSFIRKAVKYIIHIILRIIKPNNFPEKINQKIKKIIQNNTTNNDVYVGCPTWSDGIYQFEKKWFSEQIEVDFEGYKFPAPVDYKSFLSLIYGNFMELPPEDKRNPYHCYKIFQR